MQVFREQPSPSPSRQYILFGNSILLCCNEIFNPFCLFNPSNSASEQLSLTMSQCGFQRCKDANIQRLQKMRRMRRKKDQDYVLLNSVTDQCRRNMGIMTIANEKSIFIGRGKEGFGVHVEMTNPMCSMQVVGPTTCIGCKLPACGWVSW